MANEPINDFGYGEQFEPDVFWQNHGRKIILGLAAGAVIAVAGYFWQSSAESAREEMTTRFSQAKTAEDYERIIQDYGTKPVAANALFKLASIRFDEKRHDDAEQAYKTFIQQFPQNPLVPSARFGLAMIVEARGEFAKAKEMYQQFLGQYPSSALNPAVRVAVARCTEALGQTAEAEQLYQDAEAAASGQTARGTFWAMEASARRDLLKRNKLPEAPSTTPPTP
jgi:tetratricopeptide (TPR) repeat protein